MISCYQATKLISEQMDHPLSLWDKARLVFHLLNCWQCKLFKNQMLLIGASIRELADERRAFKRSQDIDMPKLNARAKARTRLTIRAKF